MTAEEFKNLPEEQKAMMRRGLGDSNRDGRERGAMVEEKGDALRNYHSDTPFVGTADYVIFTESGIRQLWRSITGWETKFRWHTHPRGGPHSPEDIYNIDKYGVPSIVITNDYIYIGNPGMSKVDDLIVIPYREGLGRE